MFFFRLPMLNHGKTPVSYHVRHPKMETLGPAVSPGARGFYADEAATKEERLRRLLIGNVTYTVVYL